mgnify:CR=1 FL=1
MDNVNLEDIKQLEDSELVQAYDEADKYIKYFIATIRLYHNK